MLQQSLTLRHFKGQEQLSKMLGTLTDRRRHERRLGLRTLLNRLLFRSEYRNSYQRPRARSELRQGVGASALESGTDWSASRNDLARQNCIVNLSSQHALAQLEPLAYRALMELASSEIPPPAAPDWTATAGHRRENEHQSVNDELRADIERMLGPRSALSGSGRNFSSAVFAADGDKAAAESKAEITKWEEAWKEFEKPSK